VFFSAIATSGCGSAPSSPPRPAAAPSRFGITTVTNVATDGCGHSTNTTFTVTVNLLTPPLALTCPANITVTAPDANGAVVSFDVTASGGCSTPTIDSSMPSGSLFPVGTTIVTNTAATPAVTPPMPLQRHSEFGHPSARAHQSGGYHRDRTGCEWRGVSFDVTASGGCTSPTVQSTPPSGSLFPVGTTIVTNTASDTCGNTTNATFKRHGEIRHCRR